MAKYTYSIIIPCYDAIESDFRRCLNSIKNQTVQPLEVVCIDDCSPVNTPQIAKEYGYTYIRHKENLNNGGARNTGIRAAKGEYLIFVNSDDWIQPDTIEEIDKVNNGEDMIAIGFQSFGAYSYGFTPDKNTANRMSSIGWYGEPMHIVNRKFILDNKLFEEENVSVADIKWCKDLENTLRTYTFVPKKLYMFQTGHATSLTTKNNYPTKFIKVKATNEFIKHNLIDALLGYIPKNGEIWYCNPERAKMLNGNNIYKTKFVDILEEIDKVQIQTQAKEKTLLTIITPYYKTLDLTLKLSKTLLPQLTPEVEWIIIDDNCNQYELNDLYNINPFVKIYHINSNNESASTPRNYGLNNVNGKYIAWIDSDDMISNDYVSTILNKIKSENFDYCYISWKFLNKKIEIVINEKRPDWNCSIWSVLYKYEKIKDLRFDENLRIAEDYDFNKKFFDNNTNLIQGNSIQKIIYYYNDGRAGSLINSGGN